MAKPIVIQYWVTYGGRFSPTGKVHRSSCERFFMQGHGRLLTPEEVETEAKQAGDCKWCGGRYRSGD